MSSANVTVTDDSGCLAPIKPMMTLLVWGTDYKDINEI